ncbi:MAG: ATP-grasp fold amidoligase family protein [Firmicutes bacterium]|nr:ATP-grasp fold amidoligase family protein [Bacillota bacterium]
MEAKSIYRAFLNVSVAIFGVTFTKKLDAKIRFHRNLNLKNPETLADKLCYMELYIEDELKSKCSDKYAVREYVVDKGLEDILVPLCAPVCSNASEIVYSALPNQFAMKATHGCAMNLICDNKSQIIEDEVIKLANKWLHEDYPRACIEPHYKKIPHRIIFEKFLQDADSIIDYKFHCFHGIPDFVLVCGNRVSGVQKRIYTLDWEPIDAMVGAEKGKYEFERPENLGRMIEISKTLAADFDFVRVDLYDINGKIYFGELTFSPASGVLPNFSEEFIAEKGRLLRIEL